MVCSHCQAAEDVFGIKYAYKDLKEYRKKGARKSTQSMLTTLKNVGVANQTLLDIGGGIGAISHELIAAGLSSAVDVDASQAYIQVAQEEAQHRGYADKMSFQHGDFVQLAPTIDTADIVTLDRVICCYPDVEALVNLSSARAKHLYGVVYPRDNILSRNISHIFNFIGFRLQGNPFRIYIHDSTVIDGIIRNNGLQRIQHKNVGMWQMMVYQR